MRKDYTEANDATGIKKREKKKRKREGKAKPVVTHSART